MSFVGKDGLRFSDDLSLYLSAYDVSQLGWNPIVCFRVFRFEGASSAVSGEDDCSVSTFFHVFNICFAVEAGYGCRVPSSAVMLPPLGSNWFCASFSVMVAARVRWILNSTHA